MNRDNLWTHLDLMNLADEWFIRCEVFGLFGLELVGIKVGWLLDVLYVGRVKEAVEPVLWMRTEDTAREKSKRDDCGDKDDPTKFLHG